MEDVPETRRIVVQYRLHEPIVDEVKEWAKETRRTQNATVELLLERGLAAERADAARLAGES
jgi:hypothetical protein